jgi:hypothetical protein
MAASCEKAVLVIAASAITGMHSSFISMSA